jgi:hypothetical protein
MRAGLRRRAAGAALTVAVAALVAAAVAGAGYGLQRALLRAPTAGELTAARIEGVLLRYRYFASEIHVEGEPPRRAECLQGWQRGVNGRARGRGARILFSDGERLQLGDRRVVRLSRASHPTHLRPIAEVELAGCTRPITNHLYGRLIGGRRAHAVRTSFLGGPALRLHVRTRRSTFNIYVDPQTLRPIGMRVGSRGVTGWSRVRVVQLTPERKRDFLRRFGG